MDTLVEHCILHAFVVVHISNLFICIIHSTQNINFLEKLEFTDPKLRSILLLKFVQVRAYACVILAIT